MKVKLKDVDQENLIIMMNCKLVLICAIVRERMIKSNEKTATISIEFGDVEFSIKCEALSDDLESLPDETIELLGRI